MKRLVIIGASGHGKVCADIAKKVGYDKIIFLDDNEQLSFCGRYKVVGQKNDFYEYLNSYTSFFVAIGNARIRESIIEEIEAFSGDIATLIHPDAVISDDAKIGIGTSVMAGVVLNPGVTIGKAGIINTTASVDHDCRLEDYIHVSVGAHIAGTVKIGARTWIGIGASVSNNLNICNDCMIGAGAVVIKDIYEPGTYIGVPAKKLENNNIVRV